MKDNMKNKKETKPLKNGKAGNNHQAVGDILSESDLKSFLLNIRDKMAEQTAAPVYAVSALNQILISPELSKLLNEENKELSRDIWLRIKQSGFQLAKGVCKVRKVPGSKFLWGSLPLVKVSRFESKLDLIRDSACRRGSQGPQG